MSAVRRVALPVVLAVALGTVPACGGSGDGGRAEEERRHVGGLHLATQHAEWGISVCVQLDRWVHAVNRKSVPLARQVAGADPVQVKASYVAFFADMALRTQRALATIRSYGDPEVEGGQATGAEIRAALARVQAALAEDRTQAEAAPTDPGTLQPVLDRLQARIDESAQTVRLAYAAMEKQGPLRLRRILGQRDECGDIYKDSPTGPVPVPPDTR